MELLMIFFPGALPHCNCRRFPSPRRKRSTKNKEEEEEEADDKEEDGIVQEEKKQKHPSDLRARMALSRFLFGKS